MYDNVNLWFAKDINNNIITIDEVDFQSKNNFYCPMCGSDLIPKAIKSHLITAHFAHIDASKCNGEGMIHFWFKNKFLEPGDVFTVLSDKERQYICKEVLVEHSYNIRDKIYRPDVTVLTECGNTIYFEMDYSNKKKIQDYIDIWLELKNIVVEVDIKKLMSKDKIPTFKALFYNGKCFNVKNSENDLYYNTIGKYKENFFNKLYTEKDKTELIKLDWFWKDVNRYKQGEIDIDQLSELINYIDDINSREIVVDILKSTICQSIIKDYVQNIKNKLTINLDLFNLDVQDININYRIKIPHKIYDRLYCNYTVEFYTNNNIVIYSKFITNNTILDNEEIVNSYNLDLLKFEKALEYMNRYKIDKKYTDQLDKYSYPCLQYYYSQSYVEHRLYLNNFHNHVYGYYISLNRYSTANELIDYIDQEIKLNDSFTTENIMLINNISKNLKDDFSNDDFDISVKIYSNRYLNIDIIHNHIWHRVFEKYKNNINDFDNLYDIIYNRIKLEINDILFVENMTNLIEYLNNKYKNVRNNWSFSWRGGHLKNNKNYIYVGSPNYLHGMVGANNILNYYHNRITYNELVNLLEIEISNFIRSRIYSKKED